MEVVQDKLKHFPNQLTDHDPDECVALTVTDLAGNICNRPFSPDFTYAATIFLEGAQPGEQGTQPWTGLQSAVAYGLLPSEHADFTAQSESELYASNWANYSATERQLALTHQMLAPLNIGVDYDAALAYMKRTGWGVMIPVSWFSSFLEAPGGQLEAPSGSINGHCVVGYLSDDGQSIVIKPFLGPNWGDGGYAILTREMFDTIAKDCFAFDPNGNHWLAIVSILITKFPYLADYTSQLVKAQLFQGQNPDFLYSDWSIPSNAHHNVRALCDLEGLTYDQKEILTACVYVESGFHINAIHENYVFEPNGTKVLSSTDFGIIQVNNFWHIGPGKDFPSSDYVLSHPEECVRWMCRYFKANGNLNAWCSYTSGAYKRWVGQV